METWDAGIGQRRAGCRPLRPRAKHPAGCHRALQLEQSGSRIPEFQTSALGILLRGVCGEGLSCRHGRGIRAQEKAASDIIYAVRRQHILASGLNPPASRPHPAGLRAGQGIGGRSSRNGGFSDETADHVSACELLEFPPCGPFPLSPGQGPRYRAPQIARVASQVLGLAPDINCLTEEASVNGNVSQQWTTHGSIRACADDMAARSLAECRTIAYTFGATQES
jgi:hypothetical protein